MYKTNKNYMGYQDTAALKIIYKFGCLAGVCSEPMNITKYLYQGILLIAIFASGVVATYEYLSYIPVAPFGTTVLRTLHTVNSISFVVYIYIIIITRRTKLLVFWKLISKINQHLEKKYVMPRTSFIAKLIFWILVLLGVPVSLIWIIPNMKFITSVAPVFFWLMQNFKIIAITAIVAETSGIVNQRQIYILEKMQLLTKNYVLSESDIEKTIRNVLKLHRDIYNITEYLNYSFGVQLLLIFIYDLTELLTGIDNVLNGTYKIMVTEFNPDAQLFQAIHYLLILFVISVSIAIAGDKIEKTGIKITKLCHILEVDIKNPIIRGHVRNLSGYLEKLRPALTLAGFIPINRNIIPLLLSSLTSYAIILIQLKS